MPLLQQSDLRSVILMSATGITLDNYLQGVEAHARMPTKILWQNSMDPVVLWEPAVPSGFKYSVSGLLASLECHKDAIPLNENDVAKPLSENSHTYYNASDGTHL